MSDEQFTKGHVITLMITSLIGRGDWCRGSVARRCCGARSWLACSTGRSSPAGRSSDAPGSPCSGVDHLAGLEVAGAGVTARPHQQVHGRAGVVLTDLATGCRDGELTWELTGARSG